MSITHAYTYSFANDGGTVEAVDRPTDLAGARHCTTSALTSTGPSLDHGPSYSAALRRQGEC
jgi:hypothetical protein